MVEAHVVVPKRLGILVLMVSLTFPLASCGLLGRQHCDWSFWNKSREEQGRLVATLSLEEQFAYHQQRRHCVHPYPTYGFSEEIAMHGEAALAFLKQKLQRSEDAGTVEDVTVIASYMYTQEGLYDAELVSLLQTRIASLRRGFYKKGAELFFRRLEDAAEESRENVQR